ncbi:Hypp1411 [Branchiostoma lanceolatum]|uniref:Hypp1411 protein n=1 Tax=Branchiostoma lanceolatum TaxID=7740 RepID=A0A8K0EN61_BRALA|nr:Hypp1411 [Branchiostoma lanceolatum]
MASQWLEPSLVLERHCTAWSSLTTCCLLQFEEDFAVFGYDFCVSLAMSEFFEPSLGGTYPTMSIYSGPLYADVFGPFYGIESGGSFPTTSPTVSSDSVLPPGLEHKIVHDLQDIWLDPEESLTGKYHSTVEREDVTQIEELARLFVFRAKTSRRWLPYYIGLSPTETPYPELQVQATESPGATPTHDDIRVLARDDKEDDMEDWLNGMTDDLDISSVLQEAGCDLLSCSDGENMSVAKSTGQFTSGQTPEGDRSVLIGCEEPQSSHCVASFIEEDDKSETADLATTTNYSQAERPLPCLLSERQSPVNTKAIITSN